MRVNRLVCLLSITVSIAGCAAAEEAGEAPPENVGQVSQRKVIGSNDFVQVLEGGANISPKYRPLIDAFGRISVGCTATHIGDGIVLTAGHCFSAPSARSALARCSRTRVAWGLRADAPSYLTSTCTRVLAAETNDVRDYAIFRVSPIPPVKVGVDFTTRPAIDSTITIFSYPQDRPLEWSQACPLRPASEGGWGRDQFTHRCDTEPGSSGATILSTRTLRVIGIHNGGTSASNYGTYLTNTPIAEFVPARTQARSGLAVGADEASARPTESNGGTEVTDETEATWTD
jgi:V8-like Glu-specific endopeptidase